MSTTKKHRTAKIEELADAPRELTAEQADAVTGGFGCADGVASKCTGWGLPAGSSYIASSATWDLISS
jgi:hypothetical protein